MDSNANPRRAGRLRDINISFSTAGTHPCSARHFFFVPRLGPDFLSRSGAPKAVDWHHFGPDRGIFRPSNEYPYFVHFWTPFSLNFLVGHIGLGGRAGGRKEGKAVSGSSLRKFDGSSTYEIHL